MMTNSGARRAVPLPVLVLLVMAGQSARADGDYFSPTDDHVRVSLGVMHVSNATNLRADTSAGTLGSDINGEGTFGLDRTDFEPKFQATVRVATRQRLSVDYFTLDRSGSVSLTGAPIAFKDVILLPGDPVQSKLSLRTFGVTYEYSFWHSERFELAATLGVHATDVSAEVRVQSATRHIIQTQDQAGPVPTVGIDSTWVASKRFSFDARGQYLKAHISNVDGSLGFYEFDALYRFRPNVSFAVGYTEIKVNLSSMRNSQSGLFDFSTKGPEMFVRIAF